MRCDLCGHENEKTAEFCQKCGTKLKKTADSTVIFTPVTGVAEEEAVIEIKPPVEEEAVLVVKKGPLVGQRFALTRGTITLGRDPGSDIFLNDITVSRKHARTNFESSRFVIHDVGSLNGTYVNGKRVEKSALRQGDELQIGKFKLIFLSREG